MEDAGHAALQGEKVFSQFMAKITEAARGLLAMHQATSITSL